MTALHQLAAGRGDGLRPEFLALYRERARLAGADRGVTEIRRPDGAVQAGPNPAGTPPQKLPDGVVAFSGAALHDTAARPRAHEHEDREESACISQ